MLVSKLIIGMTYLSKSCLFGFLITAVLFVLDFRNRKVRRKKQDYLLLYIVVVYVLTLLMITGVIAPWSIHNAHNHQLIPFQNFNITYFFLNIIVFVPMGILIPAVFQRDGKFHMKFIVIGLVISICIEFVQYAFTGRLADSDDVIANTIGCILGYMIILFVKAGYQKHNAKNVGWGTYSIILTLIGFACGIPYRYGMCLGDMILVKWGIPIWSGNQNGVLSFQGIHYSLPIYFLIQIISFILAIKNPEDHGVQFGKIFSMFGIIFFGIEIIINLFA